MFSLNSSLAAFAAERVPVSFCVETADTLYFHIKTTNTLNVICFLHEGLLLFEHSFYSDLVTSSLDKGFRIYYLLLLLQLSKQQSVLCSSFM